jgi:1L-myo-inositol 1-phosphate cytidylyltransferase
MNGNTKTTEAVIIAADQGMRTSENTTVSHKCLIPIADKTLIEHIIGNLADSGIRKVCIVTGFSGDELQEKIKKISLPLPVSFCQNEGWERGSGTSAFAAHNVVHSDHFILTMSDRWFTRDITEHMNRHDLNFSNILAVDSRLEKIGDVESATKVQRGAGSKITGVDKKLAKYDAVDCGIFRFRGLDIFPALEHAFAKQDYSLYGGVRELIHAHKMFWTDVEGKSWQDINSVGDLEAAERKLKEYLTTKD